MTVRLSCRLEQLVEGLEMLLWYTQLAFIRDNKVVLTIVSHNHLSYVEEFVKKHPTCVTTIVAMQLTLKL